MIVSIRAPRAGRNMTPSTSGVWNSSFQSAPRVRGETGTFRHRPRRQVVSIRAPRAGRNAEGLSHHSYDISFNPRPACGAKRSS